MCGMIIVMTESPPTEFHVESGTMLRGFNSLIKGSKRGQVGDDELSELHTSLRPFVTSSQHHHVSPLQQQLARAREEGLASARSTRTSSESNGQASLNASLLQQWPEYLQQGGGRAHGHGFVIGRVPEEKSWKEGYEQGNQFQSSLDSLSKPTESRDQMNPELSDEEIGAASAQAQVHKPCRFPSCCCEIAANR